MKTRWIRYGFEELKFLRSFGDLKIFYSQKLPFFIDRIFGNPVRETKVPLSLQLEPTNHCNLNCICCSRDKVKRQKGYIDYKLFQKIIDDASEIGTKRIHLYLHGEPLLHPRIVEMISYIKAKNLGITMATNGMLLNERKINKILQTGVNSSDYFIFSVLGYSKEVHENIMLGVSHERVLNNIYMLLKKRKEYNVNGPVVETVFYKMPENEKESELFTKYWQKVVDHVHPVETISKQLAEYKRADNLIPVRQKTCKNLWERMTIFWNGNVSTCIADLEEKFIFGNLRENEIKDLWNCEEMTKIKILHKQKEFEKLSLCSHCDW